MSLKKIFKDIFQKEQAIKDYKIEGYFINAVLNPYIKLNKTFHIPRFSVNGISKAERIWLSNRFKKIIPDFIGQSIPLKEPIPKKEKFFLHFARIFEEDGKKYLYIFKINLFFQGGEKDTIEKNATTLLLPSYSTEQIYYNAMLVPVKKILYNKNGIFDFEPLPWNKIKKKEDTGNINGKRFLGSELFDDIDYSEIEKEITIKCLNNLEFFNIYHPFKINYSTLSWNLLEPTENTIKAGLNIFHKICEHFFYDKDLPEGLEFFSRFEFIRKLKNQPYWQVKLK